MSELVLEGNVDYVVLEQLPSFLTRLRLAHGPNLGFDIQLEPPQSHYLQHSTLHHLELDCIHFAPEVLSNPVHLQHLSVANCDIPIGCTEQLLSVLQPLSQLQPPQLFHSLLEVEPQTYSALTSSSHLTHLDPRHLYLPVGAAQQMFRQDMQLPALKVLAFGTVDGVGMKKTNSL